MRSPAALAGLLLVACYLLLSLSCSGDDNGTPAGAGAHRVATYNERCPRCGAQWSVKVDEYATGPDTVEVTIENTGERGTLELIMNVPVGVAFNETQATSWRQIYPEARAVRDTFDRLAPLRVPRLDVRPAQGTNVPFTLRSGQTWRGKFDLVTDIPQGTVGLVFSFGKIRHELTPAGLAETDDWLTWDLSRPYIGLDGEVRITPVATPGAR